MNAIRQLAFKIMWLRHLNLINISLIFILTLLSNVSYAHPIGQCVLELNIDDHAVQGRLKISTADIIKTFRIDENQDNSKLNAIITENKDVLIGYLKKK